MDSLIIKNKILCIILKMKTLGKNWWRKKCGEKINQISKRANPNPIFSSKSINFDHKYQTNKSHISKIFIKGIKFQDAASSPAANSSPILLFAIEILIFLTIFTISLPISSFPPMLLLPKFCQPSSSTSGDERCNHTVYGQFT